jgi:hypothetical protein
MPFRHGIDAGVVERAVVADFDDFVGAPVRQNFFVQLERLGHGGTVSEDVLAQRLAPDWLTVDVDDS